jgi:hypothetical protein
MSVDPKAGKYPSMSSYSSMGNSPLIITDEGGDTLRVRVNDKQAIADIYSLVPKEHRSRITITNEGIVNINVSVKVEEGTPTGFDGNTSAGRDLLHNLVYAKENYLYQVKNELDLIRPSDGRNRHDNLLSEGDNGVDNWSDTKNFATSPQEQNKWLEDPINNSPKNIGYKPVDQLVGNYNAVVTLAKDYKWKDSGGVKPRASVVFHELWESHERTTNKLPYDIIIYLPNGGEGVDGRFNQNSAHDRAKNAEVKFHEPSKDPGKIKK